jgi:hypothetical protein
MPDSCPTVILRLSSTHMWDVSRRLTIYLLQEHLAFLQTFHAGQGTEFDIFYPQGDPVARLVLQTPESADPPGLAAMSPVDLGSVGEISPLLQRLLEICKPLLTLELDRNQHRQAE